MANRRTTWLGVAAGVVMVGGAATLFLTTRQQAPTSAPVGHPPSTTVSHLNQSENPTSQPLKMPVAGTVARGFGWQYSGALNEWYYNPGITIAAPEGKPVVAAWGGTVTEVTHEPHMGLTVTVRDGDGFDTVYGHLGQVGVKPGQVIRQGQVIGTVGGPSLYSRDSGSHVDFQVYHGATAANPMNYLYPSS
ncbi:MAG: M23 family metallopeptidase [Firmicutes bacterium]|nr:M23 family metallopeptidase [Bacillota bacterium]